MEQQIKHNDKPDTPLTLLLKSPQKSFSFPRTQTPLSLPQTLITSVPPTSSLNLDARPTITLQ